MGPKGSNSFYCKQTSTNRFIHVVINPQQCAPPKAQKTHSSHSHGHAKSHLHKATDAYTQPPQLSRPATPRLQQLLRQLLPCSSVSDTGAGVVDLRPICQPLLFEVASRSNLPVFSKRCKSACERVVGITVALGLSKERAVLMRWTSFVPPSGPPDLS